MKSSNREKAEKVSDVLFKQIKFQDIKLEPTQQEKILPYVPYGVSALALRTTFVFHTNIWWKIAAVAVPPIVLKKPIDNLLEEIHQQNAKNSIPQYLAQLDKYKEAILAVL